MPLKPCRCERKRLNEVIDQVNTLSSMVDELRKEVNTLKLRFFDRSSEDKSTRNYCESKKNKIDASTFQSLKKYFEQNVIPVIAIDAGSCVKKKLHSFLAQSLRTPVSCSRRMSTPEPTTCRNIDTFRVSSQTSTPDVKKNAKWITKKTPISKRSRYNVCKNSKQTATVSTSTQSLKKHRDKKFRCSNEYRALKSTWRSERCTRKRKTIGTARSDLMSQLTKCCIAEEFAIYPATCARRLRSINVATKAKKSIPVENNETSTPSCISTSNTSDDCPQPCKIILAKAKRTCNEGKISKRAMIRKTSKSAPCSPVYVYIVPKLIRRDISTNTRSYIQDVVWKDTVRQKKVASQDIQTCSKYDETFQVICMDEREKYCPAARTWLYNGSLTSLISRSSTTSSSPFQGLKKFDMENVSKNRVVEVTGATKNTGDEANIVSTKESEGNKPVETKTQVAAVNDFTRDRKKRTYVISKDVSSLQDDATVDHYYYGKTANVSFNLKGRSMNNQILTATRGGKILTKPEVTSRSHQGYDLPRTLCQSASKPSRNEHWVKAVCNNRPRNKYLLKLPEWCRKKSENPIDQ